MLFCPESTIGLLYPNRLVQTIAYVSKFTLSKTNKTVSNIFYLNHPEIDSAIILADRINNTNNIPVMLIAK